MPPIVLSRKRTSARASAATDVLERGAGAALEHGLRLVALAGNAEPDRPHRPRAVRDPLDRLRDGPILGDDSAGTAADDDRGARRDAEDDEDHRPLQLPSRAQTSRSG